MQNMNVWKSEQLLFDGSLGAHLRIMVWKMLVAVLSLLCQVCLCTVLDHTAVYNLQTWCIHLFKAC